MARRFQVTPRPQERSARVAGCLPGKWLAVMPILFIIALPTYIFGFHAGSNVLPQLSQFFYKLSEPTSPITPTPLPPLSATLPLPGAVMYTVQEGDSCDSILAFEMNMHEASTTFSDANPTTVDALNSALGQDCHKLQPGMQIQILPHYPLVALGGIITKIESTKSHELLPTPLIHVPSSDNNDQPQGPDCSDGCKLSVRIAPQTTIFLTAATTLALHEGSWVWTQALMARKSIPNFPNYPYADPNVSFNGMSLQACDLQIDNVHDDNSAPCEALTPNTIRSDNGSWLLAVTGRGALDHWNYSLHLPPATHVLLWLTRDKGGKLSFHPGSPAYRYDDSSHLYVKM